MLSSLLRIVHAINPAHAIRLSRFYRRISLRIADDVQAYYSPWACAVRDFEHDLSLNHRLCGNPYCKKPIIGNLESDDYHQACLQAQQASDRREFALINQGLIDLGYPLNAWISAQLAQTSE